MSNYSLLLIWTPCALTNEPLILSRVFLTNDVPKCQMSLGPCGPIFLRYMIIMAVHFIWSVIIVMVQSSSSWPVKCLLWRFAYPMKFSNGIHLSWTKWTKLEIFPCPLVELIFVDKFWKVLEFLCTKFETFYDAKPLYLK